MIVAGDIHEDQFFWGKDEQFHTVEQDGTQFRLFEVVEIKTKNGYTTKGQIGYIEENLVHILPEGQSVRKIKFADIESISY